LIGKSKDFASLQKLRGCLKRQPHFCADLVVGVAEQLFKRASLAEPSPDQPSFLQPAGFPNPKSHPQL
jgi:hypothetical protein